MRNILLVFLLIPVIAFAGIPITEGNVKQDSCGFPEAIKAHTWRIDRYELPPAVTVKNKLIPVGQVISVGDALFYANIIANFTRVSYLADSNIEVVGNSFLVHDEPIPNGSQLFIRGIIKGQGLGAGYVLVGKYDATPGWRTYVAIKDNGFLCSVKVSIDARDNSLLVQDATAYQKNPLVRHEELIPSYDDSIALTLNQIDAVSASIGIKLLRNRQVVRQKDMQIDLMSGSFDLYGLKILFERAGKSSIKIKSVSEPDNYFDWHSRIATTLM